MTTTVGTLVDQLGLRHTLNSSFYDFSKILPLPVTFRKMGTRLGTFHLNERNPWGTPEIFLNSQLLVPSANDELRDTLCHELAHAVVMMGWLDSVGGPWGVIKGTKVPLPPHHGEEWQEAARRLGARPRATNSSPEISRIVRATLKPILHCTVCNHTAWGYKQRDLSRRYTHRKCGSVMQHVRGNKV